MPALAALEAGRHQQNEAQRHYSALPTASPREDVVGSPLGYESSAQSTVPRSVEE